MFSQAVEYIQKTLPTIDPDNLMSIEKSEIEEDLQDAIFELIADRLTEDQAKELILEEEKGTREQYLIALVPDMNEVLKQASSNVLTMYYEFFQENKDDLDNISISD